MNFKKILSKIEIYLFVFLVIFTSVSPAISILTPVKAATILTVEYTPQDDTFVSPSTLNPANGTRRSIPIGTYTDFTIPGDPTFSTSRGLIKFGTVSLPAGAIVVGATLRLWHYGTNSGQQALYVSKVTSGWNGNTIWGGPSHSGDYGGVTFPTYNNNSTAEARDIALNTALISELQSPNEGIMVRNYNEAARGVVICSSNIPSGPCHGGMQPRLIISYIVNQIPNQPQLDYPDNNWELGPKNNGLLTGATCDTTGTGLGCSVTFRANAEDPDDTFPLTNTYQIRSTEGGNQDQSNNGEGWQTFTKSLNDGHWSWRGASVDTHSGNSGFSPTKTFVVDTTAPSLSTMNAEPEYSPGLQNDVSSSISTDNLIGGIQYEYQQSDDAAFTTNLVSSGWINANNFIFAGLSDNQMYYFRVRAKDSLDNVSTWSSEVYSTQDATDPVISNLTLSEQRFSPQNQDGIKDELEIDFDWTELNPQEAKIEIFDTSNNLVRQEIQDISALTGTNHFNYIWDGKDSLGTYVADGAFNIVISVLDKATNQSVNNSEYVIVDNIPASISVSNPADLSWFNSTDVTINGQTDADATLEIEQCLNLVCLFPVETRNASLDGSGIFGEIFNITDGENVFNLESTDTVGNTTGSTFKYYKENFAPTLSITPNSLINTRQPTIELNISDTGAGSFISGIDATKTYISITHNGGSELVLVNNGVNVAPTLGNIITDCSGTSNYIVSPTIELDCQYSFVFNSDLSPDGQYVISANVTDKAGNVSSTEISNFELDSNTQNDISQPSNGNLFNYSLVQLKGTAEKDSVLRISVPDVNSDLSNEDIQFTVNESSTVGRLIVENCRASGNPSVDGIKEICDWTVNDFQLEKDQINPGNISNPITFEVTDVAGNSDTKVIIVNVDVHAVSLGLTTDLQFFSPNGDGRQDGLEFKDVTTNALVDTYEIQIKDSLNNVVKSFAGNSSLPSNIPWDGRDTGGNFVLDGDYSYQLTINTTDALTFSTTPQIIKAVTNIEGQVVITYPGNNAFTTRGVTNVQGQAPANSVVRICDDVIGITGSCDFNYEEIQVDAFGSFSYIVPLFRLPDQNNTQHNLTATASDKYGNVTPISNNVLVTLTTLTPFDEVSIIPAFTGVNNESDYQIIIDKLNNNQEITQADIDSLRSVIFRSVVNQGTERVRFAFADHTNLEELPSSTQFNSLGYIDADNQTRLYEDFVDGVTGYDQCNTATCTLDFYYPIPNTGGGLYEIEFEGKLGSTIQNITSPLIIDGNIPTAPMILTIDKIIGGQNFKTNIFENAFYSNSEQVQIKGISDANANIVIKDSLNNTICTTTASAIGFWSCQTTLSYSAPSTSYGISVEATLGLNTTNSLDSEILIIDKEIPLIDYWNTTNLWHKPGDIVDFELDSNEKLFYAKNTNVSNLGCINDSTLDGAVTDFNINTDYLGATGSFNINGNVLEGRHCTIIEIRDIAGNKNFMDLVLFIDTTIPEDIEIETSTWGIYNGINSQNGFPATGRLNPGFVIKDSSVIIYGYSEENQLVDLFVNGNFKQTTTALDRSSNQCVSPNDLDITADGVLLKSGYKCLYAFSFAFDDGEKGYNFQVKTTDFAGNSNIISQSELLYFDKTPPQVPETMKVSANGNQITDWRYAKNQEVNAPSLGIGNFGLLPITNQRNILIQDKAESLSDTVYSNSAPDGSTISQSLIQKSGNGVDDRNFALNNGDGVYTFASQAWDAPGNQSDLHFFQIELDTVAPQNPSLSISQDFNGIYMSLAGEPGATMQGSMVGKLGTNGSSFQTVKFLSRDNDSDWERSYTFCVNLQDRATNKSGNSCRSITTPVRPTRSGECDWNSERESIYRKISAGELNYNPETDNLYAVLGFSKSCQFYEPQKLQGSVLGIQDTLTTETTQKNEQFNTCLQGNFDKYCQNGGCHSISDATRDLVNQCQSEAGIDLKDQRGMVEDQLKSSYKDYKDQFKRGDFENCEATWQFWKDNSCVATHVKEGLHIAGEVVGFVGSVLLSPITLAVSSIQNSLTTLDNISKGQPPLSFEQGLQNFSNNFNSLQGGIANGSRNIVTGLGDIVKSIVELPMHLGTYIGSGIVALGARLTNYDFLGTGSYNVSDYYEYSKQMIKDELGYDLGDVKDDIFKAVAGIVIAGVTVATGGFAGGLIAGSLSGTALTAGAISTISTAGMLATGLVVSNVLGGISTNISLNTGLGQYDRFNAICEKGPIEGNEDYEKICSNGKFDEAKFQNSDFKRSYGSNDFATQMCGTPQDQNGDGETEFSEMNLFECAGNQVGMFVAGGAIFKGVKKVPVLGEAVKGLESIGKGSYKFGYSLGSGKLFIPLSAIQGTADSYQFELLKRQYAIQEKYGLNEYNSKFGKLIGEELVNALDDAYFNLIKGNPPSNKPYANSRPAYGPGQVEQVWENTKKADGKVYDPNTGAEIIWDKSKPRNGQWDMGHKYGQEYWRKYDDYVNNVISQEDFIRWYRDPNNYQVELPSSNRSRKFESP